MQLRQRDGISSVRLDPVARALRDQRRRDPLAFVTETDEVTMNTVDARTRLIAEVQPDVGSSILLRQFAQCCRGILYLTEVTCCVSPASFRDRHRDCRFVNVKTDKHSSLVHDPSPLCLRLCAGLSSATLVPGIL